MKCGEVLGACVDVLKDVDEKSLLQEIAQSEESHSKLHSQCASVNMYTCTCTCMYV